MHKAECSVGNTAITQGVKESSLLLAGPPGEECFTSYLVIMISDTQTCILFTYHFLLFVRNDPSITLIFLKIEFLPKYTFIERN